jgi:hypothetical protein
VPGATNLADVPLDTTEFAASAPPGTYYARVVTRSAFGETAPSNEVTLTVKSSACTPPSFATSLDVEQAGRQVTALWSPTSQSAAAAADDLSPVSYVLEVGSQPGLADLGRFAMERNTAFSTVAPPGLYHVRVRPANACGPGRASNEVLVRVR